MKTFNVIYKKGAGAKSELVKAESQIKAMLGFMAKHNCGASAILEIIEQ